jgi:hypothetical protein
MFALVKYRLQSQKTWLESSCLGDGQRYREQNVFIFNIMVISLADCGRLHMRCVIYNRSWMCCTTLTLILYQTWQEKGVPNTSHIMRMLSAFQGNELLFGSLTKACSLLWVTLCKQNHIRLGDFAHRMRQHAQTSQDSLCKSNLRVVLTPKLFSAGLQIDHSMC